MSQSKEMLSECLNLAREMALVGSQHALKVKEDGFEIERKSDQSIVTLADREIEEIYRGKIQSVFPDHGVLGEEGGLSNGKSPFRWVLDPIDGTEEFSAGLPYYGSIIGLFREDEPLVGVITHPELAIELAAAKGIGVFLNGEAQNKLEHQSYVSDEVVRIGIAAPGNFLRSNQLSVFSVITKKFPNIRIFRSCYAHTMALLGRLDAMFEVNVKPWDLAASPILAAESGCVYQEVSLSSNQELTSAVFGNPEVVKMIKDEVCRAIS